MVVWHSGDVHGQVFDADGDPVGAEFRMNAFTQFIQNDARVAVDDAGRFVATWTSCGGFGSDTCGAGGSSIQGFHVAANGTPVGIEFQINTYTTSEQVSGSIAANVAGDFVVVWQSSGSFESDSDLSSINAQRVGFPIFADDFESGDSSAWTTTVP